MATATLEERVSRLEGGFEHLAAKADVAELQGDLHALESRLLRWMVGASLGSVAAAAAVTGGFWRWWARSSAGDGAPSVSEASIDR